MQYPEHTKLTPNQPSRREGERNWEVIALSIATHLRSEVEFLKRMLVSSQQLQRLIENRDLRTDSSNVGTDQAPDHHQEWLHQIDLLRQQIDQQVPAIQQSREELGRLLKELSTTPMATETPTASLVEVARQLKLRKSPLGDELLSLRREIKTQLRELDLINLGNQVVLAYTLDHRRRLLAGMLGNPSAQPSRDQSYNAQGTLTTTKSGNLLERQC